MPACETKITVAILVATSAALMYLQTERTGGQQPAKPLRSSIQITTGKFGKALNAATTPALIEGSARWRKPPLTVECWVKLRDKKNFNVVVASDRKSSGLHWEIYSYANTGAFSAYLPGYSPSETRSKSDICDNRWHYLAMQFDGKRVQLYVDGKHVHAEQVTRKAGAAPRPGPLTIGMALFKGGRVGCNGLIDDVRISNTIRAINGIPKSPMLLDLDTVGLWHFDSLAGFAVDPSWTPRAVTGANVPAWWKETDKDWVDKRLRQMDTGATFNATIAYPSLRGRALSMRATATRVGQKGEAAVLFDRNQLRLATGWTGPFLQHSNRRFGLLNTPKPAGEMVFSSEREVGWRPEALLAKPMPPVTTALPLEWGRYRGLYRHGKRTVISYSAADTEILESPWVEKKQGITAISRTMRIDATNQALRLFVCNLPNAPVQIVPSEIGLTAFSKEGRQAIAVALIGRNKSCRFHTGKSGRLFLTVKPRKNTVRFKLLYWRGPAKDLSKFRSLAESTRPPQDLHKWTKPGARNWTKNITTRGIVAKNNAPYVVDTLNVPYDNPDKALMFLSGLDILPNGDLAVCSAHGDVWLVHGVDDKLQNLTWKRFATGLYQPLGLKVVDGKIFVLERGQLTRLHDLNGNGEADFYENFCDLWHIAGGEHSYDSCLETDAEGNFYFFNGGDGNTPTGGCLLRVARDGKKCDVFATGFRHPVGLGASPGGVITGADQEGNWMPATRIDRYRLGGFYGDMRTHHRKVPPKSYDPPLLWLPREMDNSAGGQVWIPPARFGPLGGKMLHLSYGRCRVLAVLPQSVGDVKQAGAVDLGLQFLSGVMRGRFNPNDGCLYVCGMDGWQTAAIRDGCLQRVRFTGKKPRMPVALSVHKNGVKLTFSQPLQKVAAEDLDRWRIEQWNYRWTADYGSKRWSVQNPKKVGQDRVQIRSARLLPDGESVFLTTDSLRPVMQMQINYDVRTKLGEIIQGVIYNTIHRPRGSVP